MLLVLLLVLLLMLVFVLLLPVLLLLILTLSLAHTSLGMQVRRGMLAFAGSGADSRGCQIFVSYSDDNEALGTNPWETPFARVVEGMDETVGGLWTQKAGWNTEYGDMPPWGTGPEPGRLEAEGSEYIRDNFPKLDWIKKCAVVPAVEIVEKGLGHHVDADAPAHHSRRRRGGGHGTSEDKEL